MNPGVLEDFSRQYCAGAMSDQPAEQTLPSVAERREVCIGGLPGDFREEEVYEVFSRVGDVVEVRLPKRQDGTCVGCAYVTFLDDLAAQRACDVNSVRKGSVPVGVVVSRSVMVDAIKPEGSLKVSLRTGPATNTLSKIMDLLRWNVDKKGLLAASMMSFMDSVSGLNIGKQVVDDDPGKSKIREAAVLQPDMSSYLDKYPHCRDLMVKIRSMPNNDNKTPVGVLNEYATKLTLELQYEDAAQGSPGSFVVTCRLTSVDGRILYAEGIGNASKKKDSRQMSAAAALENLLESVPPENFMQPGKNRLYSGSGGYRGQGRNMRGRAGYRMHQSGNRKWRTCHPHGPNPVAAGKRKYEEIYTSTPALNHSLPPPLLRYGGVVDGPRINSLSNQGIGMNPMVMGMATTGMAAPVFMRPMGIPVATGNMAMVNGNEMHPTGSQVMNSSMYYSGLNYQFVEPDFRPGYRGHQEHTPGYGHRDGSI